MFLKFTKTQSVATGTCYNRLSETVLTCTHKSLFQRKIRRKNVNPGLTTLIEPSISTFIFYKFYIIKVEFKGV